MLYLLFQIGILEGVPVTMAASLQYLVSCNAGAICPLLNPPSPTRANPSLRGSSAARTTDASELTNGNPMAATAELRMNLRREKEVAFMRVRLLLIPNGCNCFLHPANFPACRLSAAQVHDNFVISTRSNAI